MNKTHHDVIFCVFACPTIVKYINEIDKINETWGSKARRSGYRVLYFVGEEKCVLQGDDYIHLKGVRNDYMSASYKQNLGLNYICENFTFNYVHVCGTDTYVNIDYLTPYLTQFNPNENICIGGHGCSRKIDNQDIFYHSGGPGFIISRCALNNIKNLLSDMVKNWARIVQTQSRDPHLVTACDLALCYYLIKNDCKLIRDDKCFFHCNHVGFPCHKRNKLGKDIVACHNMSLSDFDDFTKILDAK